MHPRSAEFAKWNKINDPSSSMSWDRPYWIDYTKSKTPQGADSCVSVLFTHGDFFLKSNLLSYDLEDFYYYMLI